MKEFGHKIFITVFFISTILWGCSTANNDPDNNSPTDPQIVQGEKLFNQYCLACHTTTGDQVIIGPPLAGIAETAKNRIADKKI